MDAVFANQRTSTIFSYEHSPPFSRKHSIIHFLCDCEIFFAFGERVEERKEGVNKKICEGIEEGYTSLMELGSVKQIF